MSQKVFAVLQETVQVFVGGARIALACHKFNM